MRFLVYSEEPELGLQLLGRARVLAGETGGEAVALTSRNAQAFFGAGAGRVLEAQGLDGADTELRRQALVKAVELVKPDVVMIGATRRGKALAARLSAALGVGCMTECTMVDVVDGGLIVERLTYGGSTVARESCSSRPAVVTVPPRTYAAPEPASGEGEAVKLPIDASPPRVRVVERRPKPRSTVDLESAPVIVSAGRGLKAREDLRLLEDLAGALGAQIGCTRPISADLGWLDQWVGISGKKVKPSLYIACGISGTIQHAAGIRGSQVIVSINSDESAGIHGISDYSIVGDLYQVVPALTRALRARA